MLPLLKAALEKAGAIIGPSDAVFRHHKMLEQLQVQLSREREEHACIRTDLEYQLYHQVTMVAEEKGARRREAVLSAARHLELRLQLDRQAEAAKERDARSTEEAESLRRTARLCADRQVELEMKVAHQGKIAQERVKELQQETARERAERLRLKRECGLERKKNQATAAEAAGALVAAEASKYRIAADSEVLRMNLQGCERALVVARQECSSAAAAQRKVEQARCEAERKADIFKQELKSQQTRHEERVQSIERRCGAEAAETAERLRADVSSAERKEVKARSELETARQLLTCEKQQHEVAVAEAAAGALSAAQREGKRASERDEVQAQAEVLRTELSEARTSLKKMASDLDVSKADLCQSEGERASERDEAQAQAEVLRTQLSEAKNALQQMVLDLGELNADLCQSEGERASKRDKAQEQAEMLNMELSEAKSSLDNMALELGGLKAGSGSAAPKNALVSKGLQNQGNRCAINSIMQILRRFPRAREYTIACKMGQSEMNKARRLVGQDEIAETLASAMGALFEALDDEEDAGPGRVDDIFGTKFLRQVSGLQQGHQVDAAEVLQAILDGLVEGTSDRGVGTAQPVFAAATGEKTPQSLCERERTTLLKKEAEPFQIITLPIAPLSGEVGTGAGAGGGGKGGRGGGRGGRRGRTSALSVPGLLRKVLHTPQPGHQLCPDCPSWSCDEPDPHGYTRTDTISILPEKLFLQFDRVSIQGLKLETFVDIPLELNMGEFISETGDQMYDLDGVVHHTNATAKGGHYVSCVRTEDGAWHHFNDAKVKAVKIGAVLTKDVVIMSYARRV